MDANERSCIYIEKRKIQISRCLPRITKIIKNIFPTKKHKQSVVNYYKKIVFIRVHLRLSAAKKKKKTKSLSEVRGYRYAND